jgi:ribonucleoside-diphosphate reductase alpha chain
MTPERLQELQTGKMQLQRFFTYEEKNPFEFDIFGNRIKWISEDVSVTDDMGKVIFTQPKVKRPDFWSPLAIKVVASKYFWGDIAKNEREDSVEKLIGRVARYVYRQSLSQSYFNEAQSAVLRDEISAICLNQLGSFNSPVWFNAGIQEYNKDAGGVSVFRWDNTNAKVVPALRAEDKPQCSACFIQSIEDNMESILALQVSEANLFKSGSGTGTNRSNLRSSKEKLTGGGRASGPVSFMRGFDAYAGIIKSGGKTRRAAKMEILNVDHPDIMNFILAKQNEEKKAWALIEQGYGGGMNGEAYNTIAFQNCNMSVRAPDEFMEAVKADKEWQTLYVKNKEMCESFKAKDILKKIAEGTYVCGDPGMQFDSTINEWHTCKASGRINASNPCITGDTRILMKNGKWKRIDSLLDDESEILTNIGIINTSKIKGSFITGKKPVYKLTTKNGYELKLTADHKVLTINRGFVPAYKLTKDDYLLLPNTPVAEIEELNEKDKSFYQMLGVYLGDGGSGETNSNRGITISMNKESEIPILQKFSERISEDYERITHKSSPANVQIVPTGARYTITNSLVMNKFKQMIDLTLQSHEKRISNQIFNLTLSEQKYVLQGLFTADGTVANYGEKSQYISLDSTSLGLIKDAQLMLLGFGIKSKIYLNRRAGKTKALLPDGKEGMKEYSVKEVHSLRISRDSRIKFEKLIGFMPESYKSNRLKILNESVPVYKEFPFEQVESLSYVNQEIVYDLTEPVTHSFVANGITIHNCGEYMFIDDSACNLASLNLIKFRTEDRKFDVEKFRSAIRAFIICMELFVDGSSYPTEKITLNSHNFRPLGLGYANLGALLMSLGLPYDSDEGRAVAAAITAILCGEAYKVSAELASLVGPFPEYQKNRDSMLNVINMHREQVKKIDVNKMHPHLRYLVNDAWDSWTDALELGEIFGYRNSQVTVLAPTGTTAFLMDCDTTGIEPDIALVKYKVLSGGGMLKIVNKSVALALRTLGYNEEGMEKIIDYIDKNDSVEGAPGLLEEHLPVFDCAFKPAKGKRSIHYQGHIKMMSVVQPFLSGGISKTINMPENVTVDEIADAYIYSWERGLKAVAIYRENSKRSQPLNTQKTEGEIVKKKNAESADSAIIYGERRKLPQTRRSITHKFDISGHEGYITIGLYDDGKPGELFVTMSKVGSTINGLVDAWATSVSLNLQYGVPVDILFSKFRHQKFEPSGFVRNVEGGDLDKNKPVIRTASSIVDYVSQFMLNNFGPGAGRINFSSIEEEILPISSSVPGSEQKIEEQKSLTDFGHEGLVCPHCGGPAKRIGNCAIYCTSCKQTTRSGCGE